MEAAVTDENYQMALGAVKHNHAFALYRGSGVAFAQRVRPQLRRAGGRPGL